MHERQEHGPTFQAFTLKFRQWSEVTKRVHEGQENSPTFQAFTLKFRNKSEVLNAMLIYIYIFFYAIGSFRV